MSYTASRKPCAQCPFVRTSLRGYLGPWTTVELLWALGRSAFPCHKTIGHDDQDLSDPRLRGCAGAAIFLNNKCELSRHPLTAAHQDKCLGLDKALTATVFSNSREFEAYHGPINAQDHADKIRKKRSVRSPT